MRTHNHIHLRHIMLYHFEKGHTAAEAFRDLNDLFGEGTIGRKTVYEWFDRFKSGDISPEDKPEEAASLISMIKPGTSLEYGSVQESTQKRF